MENKYLTIIASNKQRLDEELAFQLSISRSQAQKFIKQGVLVDDVETNKNGFIVKEGQEIKYRALEAREELKPDLDIVPYTVIYEDDDVLVINKPRGLVVHPAAGHANDTLVNYLVHHYKSLAEMQEKEENDRPGIIHRIDKDTSGLLVIAKRSEAFNSLGEQVAKHEVEREYICLVHGVPSHVRFKVDAAIGRDPKDRKKKAIVPVEYGRKAVTHFTLLWTNGKDSLLKCQLETGRTHQIRVHLSYFNLPIIGDEMYGLSSDKKIYTNGQLLHAYKIKFTHPISHKFMEFYAPVDDYFKNSVISLFSKK